MRRWSRAGVLLMALAVWAGLQGARDRAGAGTGPHRGD